ncbi:MAG: DUF393 domain-containing protein [Chloroflexi bacterium]|nr:DUF393 domain-containing protein [Chloroflexota bacterium]
MSKSAHAGRGWTLYYDGDCRLCARSVRWLSLLDFFGQIEWVPYQSLESPPPGLTWADLCRAAYLVDARGRRHEGFFAFRQLSLRLPLLIPLALVLWLPGVSILGVPAYRWVARNRDCASPRDPGAAAPPHP